MHDDLMVDLSKKGKPMKPLDTRSENDLLTSLIQNINDLSILIPNTFYTDKKSPSKLYTDQSLTNPHHPDIFTKRAFGQAMAASALYLVMKDKKTSFTRQYGIESKLRQQRGYHTLPDENEYFKLRIQALLNYFDKKITSPEHDTPRKRDHAAKEFFFSLLKTIKPLGWTQDDMVTVHSVLTRFTAQGSIETTTYINNDSHTDTTGEEKTAIQRVQQGVQDLSDYLNFNKPFHTEKLDRVHAIFTPADMKHIIAHLPTGRVHSHLYEDFFAYKDKQYLEASYTKRLHPGPNGCWLDQVTIHTPGKPNISHRELIAGSPVSPHNHDDPEQAALMTLKHLNEIQLRTFHQGKTARRYNADYTSRWGVSPMSFDVSLLSPGAGCFSFSKHCLPDDNNDTFMNDVAIAAIKEYNKQADKVTHALVNTPYNRAGTFISHVNIEAVTKHYDNLIKANMHIMMGDIQLYNDFEKIKSLNTQLKRLKALDDQGITQVRHLIPVVIKILTETAGDLCHVHCKSSKDRFNTYYATLLAVKTIDQQDGESIIQTICDATNTNRRTADLKKIESMKQVYLKRPAVLEQLTRHASRQVIPNNKPILSGCCPIQGKTLTPYLGVAAAGVGAYMYLTQASVLSSTTALYCTTGPAFALMYLITLCCHRSNIKRAMTSYPGNESEDKTENHNKFHRPTASKCTTAGVFITLLTASLTCAIYFQKQILDLCGSQPENTERDTGLLIGIAAVGSMLVSALGLSVYSCYKNSQLDNKVNNFTRHAIHNSHNMETGGAGIKVAMV